MYTHFFMGPRPEQIYYHQSVPTKSVPGKNRLENLKDKFSSCLISVDITPSQILIMSI